MYVSFLVFFLLNSALDAEGFDWHSDYEDFMQMKFCVQYSGVLSLSLKPRFLTFFVLWNKCRLIALEIEQHKCFAV